MGCTSNGIQEKAFLRLAIFPWTRQLPLRFMQLNLLDNHEKAECPQSPRKNTPCFCPSERHANYPRQLSFQDSDFQNFESR